MANSNAEGPQPTLLPDAPSRDFMTEAQWETLFALVDGILPSITSATSSAVTDKRGSIVLSDRDFEKLVDDCVSALSKPPPRNKVKDYLEYRPSQDANVRDSCLRSIADNPQRGQLSTVLNLLGQWFRDISGYSDVPRDWKPNQGHDYDFLQVPAGTGIHEISTDVVIVGSGCGGGVSAKNIAEAGHRVIVVDKGYYFPPTQLPMTQPAASHYLLDAGGAYFSDSNSTGVICGGSWGGGGTVNWSVCFRLEDHVRDEWAASGLPLFASSDFDDSMDRVWDFVGASKDAIRHNGRNQALLDGAQKLGWKGGAVEQNTAGKEHYCGHCHLGCGSGEKRGPAVAWLPAAGKAGAEFMEGFAVDRVLFAEDGVTATGVEGLWTARGENGHLHEATSSRTQRRVVIKAKKVIVSGGSIWSPVILAKSGVMNRQVGRNLHLHPTNLVSAVFGTREMLSWEGGIITSYVSEFDNLDGKGHGAKLEPTCNVPYTTFAVQSWKDGVDAKVLALKYRHLGTFISLVRDRDTGRVYADPDKGTPRIDYTMSDFDRQHALEGVVALAKICYVTGATEIRPHYHHLAPFTPKDGGKRQAELQAGEDPEFTDADFAAWIRELRRVGNEPPVAISLSAHQMGSCRMSADEESGVVDMHGKVWGTSNLYVADASVFPSASGVNPMITTMALADWISRGVARELDG
ncbi:hypothetical protein UVI_02003940 [Ustilaginoidea virens]|uniref:Long-chain-alcohol oxidase n=1 Tax=Ustilaginoidea virens TaxID=1159556 RepID=A0A1B5KSJ8_USTVR|nr:hypothetical protein UVI_02003940 [Ustilaginoidea virens]